MQVPAIAERMNLSIDEAKKILNDFFEGFPGIKQWIDETEYNARELGYVEDLWGRRRRLPDIMLPQFSITSTREQFNPLLGSSGNFVDNKIIEEYRKKLEACKWSREIKEIQDRAKLSGIEIRNNGGFISRAQRQCVNARIQGGAATMTKKAMLLIYNDEVMKKLGFRLLLAVHDELIGEVPKQNANDAKERLSYLMRIAAQPECMITMKCDALEFPAWYYDVRSEEVKESYKEYLNAYDKDDAIKKLKQEYCELDDGQINQMLGFI